MSASRSVLRCASGMWRSRKNRPIPAVPEPDRSLPFNELQGENEIGDGTIGLSLSGGGYRATLFAAGAIAALADAGLWPQVRWTASVSGGSFANVAAALMLSSTPARAEVDCFLRAIVDRTNTPLSLVAMPRRFARARGPSLVARAYEAGIDRTWLDRESRDRPLRLTDLQREDRTHAFLAVDLASLAPVFLSDRLIHSRGLEAHIAQHPGELALAAAIRASASFPMLPAVHIRAVDLGSAFRELEHDLFLGDGGVWNNLGTHWEEQIRWLDRERFGFPASIPDDVDWHVVVDSSAVQERPPRHRTTSRLWGLDRPLLAVDRSMQATFASTIESGRRALAGDDGALPRRVMLVAAWKTPYDDQLLSKLVGGVDRRTWQAISDYNSRVKTVVPTLIGVDALSASHLMAHGYAQTAAALTARGIPFDVFEFPHHRVRDAVP